MPQIGVVLGSDSDLPKIVSGIELMNKFGLEYEIRIISAHRTPTEALNYAQSAKERGLQVIISVAGMAAHLGGVLAASTTLPVIGVPIASGAFSGIDAVYANLQMPPGVPVAVVGVDNMKNAVLLAAQIIALSDKNIAKKVEDFRGQQREEVIRKDEKLQQDGYRHYLQNNS
ncbi:MAG TPA: 5-(carboxyamino)imidazole ribonucleotide mutase [Firmicutes bacterium]|nr:5-(carboxyamino)imidazole ribonucleotide mutase [Bacillota bacterium]